MELKDGISTFYAQNVQQWRDWLSVHSETEKSIWLIMYKKSSATPSIYYDEAVDQALCFGWIDSKPNKRDSESFYQFFAKRNPGSNWSRVNKEKIARLTAAGLMAAPGLEMVAQAKARGTWDALNDVENGVIPDDLRAALDQYAQAGANFEAFPRSVKRGILEWIFNAKRAETRQKRIDETARLANENIRANQFKR
jgi:uncharacterized protein YdeI (YjbR/CyaY-like superfamily)